MIGWLAVIGLAVASLGIAIFALRVPKQAATLLAATLVFGLAGYAWQGSPEQPSAPKEAASSSTQSGEAMVAARHSLFDETLMKPSYLITSDGFARRGRFADAAGFLRRGLAENPNDLESWLALGMALVAHADGNVTPAARRAYDRAAQINPDNPAPRFFLGAAYLQGRDFLEAREVWAQLLEDTPDDAPFRADLQRRVDTLDEMIANAPMLQGR